VEAEKLTEKLTEKLAEKLKVTGYIYF